MVQFSTPLLIGVLALWAGLASAQQKVPDGCASASTGDNCAKRYKVKGGTAATGHRVRTDAVFHCSPSCTDASNPKVCSLIVAMHGTSGDPAEQEYLMLGNGLGDPYNESEDMGGPFCIAFPKSKGEAWDYSCETDDADYVEGLIRWSLNEFPIDPKAVFLHGYSSGGVQTSYFMFAGCKVEPLISAAAPYAGTIPAVPTTKAAMLIVHGTHDNVVPMREDWINDDGVPSCECNGLQNLPSCFNDNKLIMVSGETYAAGLAIRRGYTGDIFKDYPAPSGKLDLVPESCDNPFDPCGTCQERYDACINPNVSPNPFNTAYDCANKEVEEAEIIEFPITENAGPVTLWKVNYLDHDYPLNRKQLFGVTEFFLQLRIYFNNNRGRYPNTEHVVDQAATDVRCSDPANFLARVPPESFFRYDVFPAGDGMTAGRCKEICQNDFRCTDAFFVDYTNGGGPPKPPTDGDDKYKLPEGKKGCLVYTDPYPCLATEPFPGVNAVHFKSGGALPTDPPTSKPTAAPTVSAAPTASKAPSAAPSVTSSPTSQPTGIPDELCYKTEFKRDKNVAGFSCYFSDTESMDAKEGITEEECKSYGAYWTSYKCKDIYGFYAGLEGPDARFRPFYRTWWKENCCTDNPNSSPKGALSTSIFMATFIIMMALAV